MDTSDTIAIVAAAASLLLSGFSAWTAHKARTWQRDRDRERLETRVKVTLAGVYLLVDGIPQVGVTLTAINDGEITEYVEEARVQGVDPTTGRIEIRYFPPGVDSTDFPRELPPRSNIPFDQTINGDIGWVRSGLIGVVYLASGHSVVSDVVQVTNLPEQPT